MTCLYLQVHHLGYHIVTLFIKPFKLILAICIRLELSSRPLHWYCMFLEVHNSLKMLYKNRVCRKKIQCQSCFFSKRCKTLYRFLEIRLHFFVVNDRYLIYKYKQSNITHPRVHIVTQWKSKLLVWPKGNKTL